MRKRHSNDLIGRRLKARSAVDETTPLVNKCHCRPWTGGTRRGGYGRMWDGERLVDTHRLAFDISKEGPIPPGMNVLHHCDNPPCIEERHLYAGTHAQNMADKARRGRARNGSRLGRMGPRGEKHGLAKLDEATARRLKALVKAPGRRNVAALAREHGVSPSLLYGLRDGRNWGWL